MKNLIRPTFCQAVLFSVVALFAAKGVAQSTASDIATSQDCSKINLQVLEGEGLTREEKIALLDQAFLDSLTSFDPCQSNGNDGAASGSGVGSGAGSGVGSGAGAGGLEGAEGAEGEGTKGKGAKGEGASGTETAMESTAASDIQGDIPDSVASQDASAADEKAATNKSAGDLDAVLSSSKAPEDIPPDDIPPVENDDIIAKQFRQAAIEETDPVAKAKLWNEYRRYKNLPVQKAPEN